PLRFAAMRCKTPHSGTNWVRSMGDIRRTRELNGLRRDRGVGDDETTESDRCVSQQGAVKRRTRARSGYAAWASSRRPQHLPQRGLARQCNVADRPWHAFGLGPGNMKGDTAPASAV